MARHTARGKLAPRDRVSTLLDPGAPFLELAPLAGWRPLAGAAAALHASDRVFFYRRLVLAEATGVPAAAAGVACLAGGSPSPHG
jgi:hypothetical protein